MNWKEFLIVGFAGAIGGLAALLIACYSAHDWASLGTPDTPTFLLCGMLAACLGVYLLANTDRKDFARCLCFAAACGLAWKPVLDAGTEVVKTGVANKSVTESVEGLKKKVEQAKSEPGAPQTLLEGARDLSQQLAKIDNPALKRAASEAAGAAVETAAKSPEAAGDAKLLYEIALTAERLNLPELHQKAKIGLHAVANLPSAGNEEKAAAHTLMKGL
jgi:hypothetical protein